MADETRAVRMVETGEHRDRVLIVEDEDNAREGRPELRSGGATKCRVWRAREEALAKFSISSQIQ